MKNAESAEFLPRPRSLLIAATLTAASVTYLSGHMAEAVVNFRSMFKDLGVPPSASAQLVFSVPQIWWLLALASIAVLVWIATQSQLTAAMKCRMKTALFVTVALTALTYGFTAFAIYTPLFKLRGGTLMLNVCHCGDARAARKDIDALRKADKPIRDNVGARPFVTLQSEHDGDSPRGRSYYMSGAGIAAIEPTLLDHAVRSIQEPGAELGKISITQVGGAIARVTTEATAYANRMATFNPVVRASWDKPEDAAARTAWQKSTWKGFEPFVRGIYANLSGGAVDPKVLGTYGANMKRLVELKTQFDPTNLFHLNPNIPPRPPA